MKRRIFLSIFIVGLAISVFITMMLVPIMYNESVGILKDQMRAELEYIETGYEINGVSYLNKLDTEFGGRITLIAPDGEVLYDSVFDVDVLENHADREEVEEAFKSKSGTAVRFSSTYNEETHYYARLMSDGNVIRIANTSSTMTSTIISGLPWIIMVIVVVVLISYYVARRQTSFIIEPINSLNLDNPKENKTYRELEPFLQRLENQRQEIQLQIQELNIRQTEFAAFMQHMNEGLVIVNRDKEIMVCNSSAKQFLSYKNGNLVGKNISELKFEEKFAKALESCLKGKRKEFSTHFEEKQCRVFVNPVIIDEDVFGAVILIVDETEKLGREALRREFSANVSHELKTPLTSISGYAEIMKNGLVKSEDMSLFAEKIYKEAQRLILLVQDIIKLSRMDENENGFQKDPVELLSLAKSIEESLRDTQKKSDVNIYIEGTPQTVLGIPVMLGEMLYNLCDNGVKYNERGGIVSVNISKEKNMAKIMIKDTGIGVSESDKERIFERFYRVDKSHSKTTGGTGLGLSIVKHCVILHAGQIYVDSELGKGTTITVYLPLMDVENK